MAFAAFVLAVVMLVLFVINPPLRYWSFFALNSAPRAKFNTV